MNKSPRFMIAAPSSGSGKTMLTCGLMRLLQKKGYEVQGFKCGPDYIDPMFHTRVLGIPSVNLDSFFLQKMKCCVTCLIEECSRGIRKCPLQYWKVLWDIMTG